MTSKQLADYLQVSVSTLEKQRSLYPHNHPPYLKLGRCVRYKTADVARWLMTFDNSTKS
ncbi:MAG: helix-turn-helix transcriptional regulator [Methylobacter sp.]